MNDASFFLIGVTIYLQLWQKRYGSLQVETTSNGYRFTYLVHPEFSDNGRTWHGAYGPRLRNWNGVDQIDETRRLLLEETATRRAVMSLYDPSRDFVKSKDVPCNNWLNWLVRDGKLHLTVGNKK